MLHPEGYGVGPKEEPIQVDFLTTRPSTAPNTHTHTHTQLLFAQPQCARPNACMQAYSVASVMSDSLPARLLCPWDSLGKNTEVGCHALLHGIFPTQGLNWGLLHCRRILYQLRYQLKFVKYCFQPHHTTALLLNASEEKCKLYRLLA